MGATVRKIHYISKAWLGCFCAVALCDAPNEEPPHAAGRLFHFGTLA
jgi:hypothetical protein